MSSAASITTYQRVAFRANGSGSWSCFPRVGFDVSKKGGIIVPDVTTGVRSRLAEHNRDAPYAVNGPIVLPWTPAIASFFLPYITGDASSPYTNQEPSGGLLPLFESAVNRISQVHNPTSCVVSRATWSFQRGQVVNVAMDIEALDEAIDSGSSINAAAINALSISLSPPYIFSDCVLTIGGTTYPISGGSITFDNVIEAGRWLSGSLIRDSLPSTDLRVMVNVNMPYNSATKALYNTGIDGAAVVLTMTNGSAVSTFTFPEVEFPANPPTDGNRTETELTLSGEAFSASSGNVYSITQA